MFINLHFNREYCMRHDKLYCTNCFSFINIAYKYLHIYSRTMKNVVDHLPAAGSRSSVK